MSRVTELLKSAVELNLKYTSTLLHLSKDYLKDAGEVISRDAAPPAPAPAPAPRAPLLIVGRSGETGNAAFSLNNPTDKDLSVHLVVQGDLGNDHVQLDPARFTLKPDESTFVRILVSFENGMPANQDQVGQVVAPGLSNQGVPFIVRRLPSPDVPAAEPAPEPVKAAAPRARRAAG